MSPCSSPAARPSPNRDLPRPQIEGLSEEQVTIPGDGGSVEADLEKSGKVNELQRHRLSLFRKSTVHFGIPDSSFDLLNTEQELRELVQEEIAIREGLSLNTLAGTRLRYLNVQYQILSQRWWFYRGNLEPTGQMRAFELWRSHPLWYMHSELVNDCVGRMGCCARGCGCCSNRTIHTSRSLGIGHCTLECGCCSKARRFEFSGLQKADLRELYKFKRGDKKNYRSVRIARIMIWGLFGDSWANPFDMINAPPTYEECEGIANAEVLSEKVQVGPSCY